MLSKDSNGYHPQGKSGDSSYNNSSSTVDMAQWRRIIASLDAIQPTRGKLVLAAAVFHAPQPTLM